MWNNGLVGGGEEAPHGAKEERQQDEMPELQQVRHTERGNQQDGNSATGIRPEHHLLPWKTVGNDSPKQQQGDHGKRLGEYNNAHRCGRACQLKRFPGQGRDKCAITEGGDGLARPQQGKWTRM